MQGQQPQSTLKLSLGQRLNQSMLIVAVTLAISLLKMDCKAAEPAKGENKKIFGLLCGVVLAAEEEDSQPVTLATNAEKAVNDAENLALYLNNAAEVQTIAEAKTTEEINALTEDKAPESCKGAKLQTCKAAALYYKALTADQKSAVTKAATDERGFRNLINMTAIAVVQARRRQTQGKEDDGRPSAKQLLKQAVYGEQAITATAALKGPGSSRKDHCGDAQSKPGASAKKTIAASIACLCANDGSNNKACYPTQTAQQTSWTKDAEIKDWTKMKAHCKAANPPGKALTPQRLRNLLQGIKEDLYETKGTDGTHWGILGARAGTGAGACDGTEDSNAGACASFAKSSTAIEEPDWLALIDQAATKLENSASSNTNMLAAEAQIHALNQTLTTLISLNAMEALKQPTPKPANSAQAPSADSKNQQEEAEKDCNKKEKESECKATPKCAWNGEAKPPKKKCTLSEEAKQAAEAANQETGGKDGKPTNTTGSNSVLINKAPLLLAVLLF
uniref:Variable surface glycoprotein n=1 Tax=Trypanosoma evansi TaxID=5697 RepID=Q968L4_TRYEV|nr:variable surface glycoprotein [Trypanosoma evansi]